ncbi:hypothetical protein LTR37_007259 [Vermiconidia calcicola]|uniref:Uncharacterized protein n=1 Tax=Vermiconidia calcicola TaxID=1690605 RepID=A0ACC3NE16_9PEZI|nr:hypothetical protein LTR37_007259 [Vermiconidia calcicola]
MHLEDTLRYARGPASGNDTSSAPRPYSTQATAPWRMRDDDSPSRPSVEALLNQAPLLRSPYPLSLDVREAPQNRSSQQAQAAVLSPSPADNAQGARSSRNLPQITAPPHRPPSVANRSITPSSTGAVDGDGEEYVGSGMGPSIRNVAEQQAMVANRVRHVQRQTTMPERVRTQATARRQPTGQAATVATVQRRQQASNNYAEGRDRSEADGS